MSPRLLSFVTLFSACGSALVAGAFFAFSTFIMKALGRLPPAQGIAAMQSINITVINAWFLAAFVGTAVASAVLVIASLVGWSAPGAWLRLGGGLLYLVGTILVTRAFNIPRNDALAALQPDSVDAVNLWARYLPTWTAWNHVRTIAALAAAVLFILALVDRGR